MNNFSHDVIIVGGGPAGLSAALVLGRCRRRVLVFDSGRPRNAASHGLHNYLTRDGIEPLEFLALARQDLIQHDNVELKPIEVKSARRLENGFEVTASDDQTFSARKLLLATGVADELPQLNSFNDFYGSSIFHCPYCDGWEMRDQPLAIYGKGEKGSGLAMELLLWSRDLVLCTDGPADLGEKEKKQLAEKQIAVREERIIRLEGMDGRLENIVFDNGDKLARRGIFFSTGQRQSSDLSKQLGCNFTEEGCVATGEYETTNVPGLYVAGDASRLVQFVIVAAAEGAQAAVAINKELIKEDL